MVAGAFAGWLTVYAGGSLWTGVLVRGARRRAFRPAACLVGGLALSQHVAGLGITHAGDGAVVLRLSRELPKGQHAARPDAVPRRWTGCRLPRCSTRRRR